MASTLEAVKPATAENLSVEVDEVSDPGQRDLIFPQEIRDRKQWVVHNREKQPVDPRTLQKINWRDKHNWLTFEQAILAVKAGKVAGVGYVLTEDDPFTIADLDGLRDPQTGELCEVAREIIEKLNSFTEISLSGAGLHIIIYGKLPDGARKKITLSVPKTSEKTPGLEMYSEKRYFALTGEHFPGAPKEVRDRQDELEDLLGEFGMLPIHAPRTPSQTLSTAPRGVGRQRVVERARRYLAKIPGAVSGQDGHRETFITALKVVCGFDLTRDEAWVALQEWNMKCQPPWSEGELWHKIDDTLASGGERGWLLKSARSPASVSSVAEPNSDPPKTVRNSRQVENEKGKKVPHPLPMSDILGQIHDATGGWPRRVGSVLFSHEGDDIAWLEKTAALNGWLGSQCGAPANFIKSPGFHSQAEVFEELRRTSQAYDDVETLPHHPRLNNVYYACGEVAAGDGSKLRELVSRFNPETPIDAELILAMIVTPCWGGTGSRPAFCITSGDGRGAGKSTLAQMVGRVWGGRIEVSPDESIEKIKDRLLSSEAATKRVAVIDNVKSRKFSNSSIEGLITSDLISGKRMYVGEAQRPNNLTWVTTLNGVSFATDMAQRSVIIKIRKPTYSGNWQDETAEFIDRNRDAIIADCIGFLSAENDHQLSTFTRWGNFERDVLSRLPDPAEVQRVILERQGAADTEGTESSDFEDVVRGRLAEAGCDPETAVVFIPNKLAAECLNEVTGERYGVTKATAEIKQRIEEGHIRSVTTCGRNYGRGFAWRGPHASSDAKMSADLV